MIDSPAIRVLLPRSVQLRSKGDYAHVYANGIRVRGDYMRMVAAPSTKEDGARMGLSVGRKFNTSAVRRNRMRRVLRSAFRLQRQQLPSLDIILIPTSRDLKLRTPEIEAELVKLCAKVMRKLSAQ